MGNRNDIVHKLRTALRKELDIRDAKAVVKLFHTSESVSQQFHMHDVSIHLASNVISQDIHFASSGTFGIVDLGA